LRRDGFGDYSIYRTIGKVSQRCWVFTDDTRSGIQIVLFVEFSDMSSEQLRVGPRPGCEPLLGLNEDQIVALVSKLAEDLATPEKVRKLTLSDAMGATRRFAERATFPDLVTMYFLACLSCGQQLTSRFMCSTILRFKKASKAWKHPDIVAVESGWGVRDKARDYEGKLVGLPLEVALSQRDRLQQQWSGWPGGAAGQGL
jgi:hypothetical protein